MPGTKEIKRRIISIRNTKKITKAMELVAASKMKRAVSAAFASRPYSGYSWEVLAALSDHVGESTHPYFLSRVSKKILVVMITSNRGLCGGYNSQVFKRALTFIGDNKNRQLDFVSIGRKGETALRHLGQNIIASFNELREIPGLRVVIPVINFFAELYKSGEYEKVLVVSTFFKSGISQVVNLEQLLPIEKNKVLEAMEGFKKEQAHTATEYIFEPDYKILLNIIVDKILRTKFYQMILDSNASEQSARMMAMKNASDASGEMIDDLTLMFNKARQANITREISEISAGMASVG